MKPKLKKVEMNSKENGDALVATMERIARDLESLVHTTFATTVDSEDKDDESLVKTLERIAQNLERLVSVLFACAGLLGLIAFVLVMWWIMGTVGGLT